MSTEKKNDDPVERRLHDERQMVGMAGENLAAVGHELADEHVAQESKPESKRAVKRKNKRKKKADIDPDKQHKLEEEEAIRKRARREEAELMEHPWGDKTYPADH